MLMLQQSYENTTLHDEDNTSYNEDNTLEDKSTGMQNKDSTLKYQVNQATLLSLPVKIKISATGHLEGKKYFLPLGKL